MKIEINPRSLLNLEHIVEVLYKLHPSVLDDLVEMERSLGDILGTIDLSNPSLEEREFLFNCSTEENKIDFDEEENINGKNVNDILAAEKAKYANDFLADGTPVFKQQGGFGGVQPTHIESLQKQLAEEKEERREERFSELRKYIQLDTYEYIPMKIFVEIDDPVVGRKVKELVGTLEKTRAPEQFYLHKKEIDEDA